MLDHRGLLDAREIADRVRDAAASAPGPMGDAPVVARAVRTIPATAAERLTLDRGGYVVVVPDRRRGLLVAEHYENRGVLTSVVEGRAGPEIVATLLREGLVTRVDHAAYLGRELALAERALRDGEPYVQDAAPGDVAPADAPAAESSPPHACGCSTAEGCP